MPERKFAPLLCMAGSYLRREYSSFMPPLLIASVRSCMSLSPAHLDVMLQSAPGIMSGY